MYILQKNPAAIRSQEMICKAVCKLMAELSFEEITVTRICQEALVGRKTFYRNFERKEDVVELMIDHIRAEYEKNLEKILPEQAAYHHFVFLSKHMEFLVLLQKAGQTPLLTGRFHRGHNTGGNGEHIHIRGAISKTNPVDTVFNPVDLCTTDQHMLANIQGTG